MIIIIQIKETGEWFVGTSAPHLSEVTKLHKNTILGAARKALRQGREVVTKRYLLAVVEKVIKGRQKGSFGY
jgi:hypothetical protein